MTVNNNNKNKKVFVSFADSRYTSAIVRLRKEIEGFDFDEIHLLSECDLPKNYFKGLSPRVYRRGYGYWTWKPYIVKTILESIQDGDYLVYSDCGNHWIDGAKSRFDEYISMVNAEKPILVFQQQFLEKDWTKRDTFDYICGNQWKDYAVSLQIWSGCFIIRKNEVTCRLVDKWLSITQKRRDLFTDKASILNNTNGFQEHRHDQSCFSLLVKQVSHIEISWMEVDDLDGKWANYGKYPIQARRSYKANGITWFFDRVLLKPYRWLIGQYLVWFQNFYFRGRKAWIFLGLQISTLYEIISLGGGN